MKFLWKSSTEYECVPARSGQPCERTVRFFLTLYDSPDDLVDYTYDKKTKTYRVLEQVIKRAEFRVKILDRNFKTLRTYPLKEEGDLKPFRVF